MTDSDVQRPIERVLVVGYGVMGRGIALTFGAGGFDTAVWSRRAASLSDLPPGVRAVASPPTEAPDLVIESVLEDRALKQQVYAAIEAAYPATTIIGTNTSGLALDDLSAGMRHPERFVGTHYFMPAEVFAMVEVMAGTHTPRAVVDRVAAAMRRTGKDAITLYKPIVGYLINRLQHCILHEAYRMIETGVASPAEIDRVARLMLGPRMCINGLIEQKDIGGLEIHVNAHRAIVPALHHEPVANRYLQALGKRGEFGIDAGLGFYDWRGCDAKAVRRQTVTRLNALLEFLNTGLGPTAERTTPQSRPVEPAD
ncbi:MAG TPA: 3-hydroxyacyl-CoA dehydrogenase NAD-binding domain-containing protein [Candidatus Sulfotelmatobacter sp.]|nr:3-hydroxyacyl-CoA dehydrogenase NAD-binding domain-containing protein [Candidatus Sulfotelmatobacter sp.]